MQWACDVISGDRSYIMQ